MLGEVHFDKHSFILTDDHPENYAVAIPCDIVSVVLCHIPDEDFWKKKQETSDYVIRFNATVKLMKGKAKTTNFDSFACAEELFFFNASKNNYYKIGRLSDEAIADLHQFYSGIPDEAIKYNTANL
ncbi:MAG: hypothetical protein A2Y16_05475 [Tenericutes bacterium GWF2_57_13]|nr:MAG: hypothetical protein A2Y16_05475 [Tenericutes bacterium GWF2_57_13]